MASERFSVEEHLHQQLHEQDRFESREGCWCKGASNLEEVKRVWMQEFMAQLKPSIGEEVENALNRVLLPYLPLLQKSVLPPNSSSLLHQAESSATRSLELQFTGNIPDTMLTMDKIEDEGASLEVELLESGKRVEIGPESSMKIKIDVLDGDFDIEDRDDWTEEDYTNNIARPRKTKGPLLKGKCEIVMSRGVASVSHIAFTDNSKSMRNGTFRLGVKVVKGLPPGVVVKAAVSESFMVKERRLKNDRKHKFPSAEDQLWRLVNIRNNGQIYQRAVEVGIFTVKDFLQCFHTYREEVQKILRVPAKRWNAIVKNAEACKLMDKFYRYHHEASGDVLLLDGAFNIESVAFKGQIRQPYKDLDDFQKKQADILRRTAYEKRNELEIIDDPATETSVQAVPPSSFGVQLPPPSINPKICGLSGIQDAGSLISSQMYSTPPTNFQYDDQGAMLNLELHEDEQLEAMHMDWDLIDKFCASNSHDRVDVTSKLRAVCYVTKAAALFMISFHQDPSNPSKKRKFQ